MVRDISFRPSSSRIAFVCMSASNLTFYIWGTSEAKAYTRERFKFKNMAVAILRKVVVYSGGTRGIRGVL